VSYLESNSPPGLCWPYKLSAREAPDEGFSKKKQAAKPRIKSNPNTPVDWASQRTLISRPPLKSILFKGGPELSLKSLFFGLRSSQSVQKYSTEQA